MADVKLEGPVFSPPPPPPPPPLQQVHLDRDYLFSLVSAALLRFPGWWPRAGGPGCGTEPCRRWQLPLLHSDGIVCTSRG